MSCVVEDLSNKKWKATSKGTNNSELTVSRERTIKGPEKTAEYELEEQSASNFGLCIVIFIPNSVKNGNIKIIFLEAKKTMSPAFCFQKKKKKTMEIIIIHEINTALYSIFYRLHCLLGKLAVQQADASLDFIWRFVYLMGFGEICHRIVWPVNAA